ncbi:MAG: ACT domain-containing protein [Boseongicola sp.]|nr:ACT domain-containing protein [Boseongicola sp.]
MNEQAKASTDLTELVAGLTPVLQPGTFVFCSVFYNADAAEAISVSIGTIREDEGMSLILPRTEAVRLGLVFDATFRQITLMVNSSLEAIGLTASVSSALAREGIAANVVAGTNHDHIFVPTRRAEDAVNVLRELQADAQAHLA